MSVCEVVCHGRIAGPPPTSSFGDRIHDAAWLVFMYFSLSFVWFGLIRKSPTAFAM